MLRRTGPRRRFGHNIALAILLCLNAGFINAAGFMAFGILTTNVTGHAALLAVNVALTKPMAIFNVACWLLFFLAGAFSAGIYIHWRGKDRVHAYTAPILLIIGIDLALAVFGHTYPDILTDTEYFAGSLLFGMGMQNALVTIISGAQVRTTHLTGIFTDLGINLSAAATGKDPSAKRKIILQLTIIFSFLAGGICGGISYQHFGFRAFLVSASLLSLALCYDYIRIPLSRRVLSYFRTQ